MRVGIFPAIVGRQGGGVETYEISLMRELARLPADDDWHVYCLSQSAVDAFAIEQPNVRFETLRPASRWISSP
ncbi:MAG: hypothetical protein IT423_15275 [Pirellulaceae bacterium]|nr:hypothetical protein [Pirellulaceae bacterium]